MISEKCRVSGTKKCQKFQSVFLGIFWSEMNRKLSKTPKNRIVDHPWPYNLAQTPSTLSAKKISKSFFGLFSPVMDAESKITPWKTILDDLRGVQGVWDKKNVKNFKVFFWVFSGQKWIENWVKPPKTAFWTTLDPIMWLKHLPPFQPKNFKINFLACSHQ